MNDLVDRARQHAAAARAARSTERLSARDRMPATAAFVDELRALGWIRPGPGGGAFALTEAGQQSRWGIPLPDRLVPPVPGLPPDRPPMTVPTAPADWTRP